MHERISCSGQVCDHELRSQCEQDLYQVNIHKAAVPDGLLGCVPRACAAQLARVFTDIFNLSLAESVIPTCFKQTSIVPVLKKTKVTCLNDYQPVVCSHEVP